ncbi:hypothetical protein PVAP13_J683878 [Panicum virgatum]|nr:hypothetical protein PVAP13_J683878 [Panicum virgatum]
MECQRNSNYVRLRKKSCVDYPFSFSNNALISFLIPNSIFLLPITSKAFRRNTSCLFTFVVLCIVSTIASLVLVEESPCRPSPRSLRSCPTVLESVQELLQRPGIDVGLESGST